MHHLGPMFGNHHNGACNRRIQIRVCVYIYMYIHHIYLCAYDRGIPRHPLVRCLPETQHYLLCSCAAHVRIFPRPSVAQLAARFKILGFRARGSGLGARGSGLRVHGMMLGQTAYGGPPAAKGGQKTRQASVLSTWWRSKIWRTRFGV